MKMGRTIWLTLVVVLNAVFANVSQAHTNSCISSTDGFWDEARIWSLNKPPSIRQSAILITNAASETVTIDSTTATHFKNTMTISNLNVATPSGTDTLYLENTGTTALHILDSLIIGISFNIFGDEDPGGGALISSNSTLIVDGLLGGQLVDDGTMVIMDGSLITTNCTLQVGTAFAGLLIISNSIVQARDVAVVAGESTIGTIEAVGGTMTLSSSLTVGANTPNSQDSFLVANGGLLVVTNGETFMGGSHSGGGTMTVSNATFLAADVGLGGVESGGALVIDNGTVTLSGQLGIGFGDICGGSVSLSGGMLVVTNNTTTIGGDQCDGELTIEDGLFVAREIFVGFGIFASGVLTVNGGTTQLSSNLQIGTFGGLNFGSVVVNGGQLVATNGEIMVERGASIIVSDGLLAAKYIDLGPNFGPDGLSINGGSVTASTGITLGDCTSNTLGYVSVDGGELTVTNAAHTGFIDVQNGQLVLSNGVLQVDNLVMTNTCSSFIHTGGKLIVGSVILDPNAFQITSVTREGNDLRVTWLMAPGQTNALQVSSGGPHGAYTTNIFTDLFTVTNNTTAGTLTNYLDIGAATNKPSRYYRARLVP
jgi:hypothetical protein